MSTRASQVGSQFETDSLTYLRERGVHAERLAKAGKNDEGDLVVVLPSGNEVVLELKVRRSKTNQLSLGTFLREAVVEAARFAFARSRFRPPIPAVLIKRSNHPIGESYVVLRLEDFIKL
jgi:Holliday junction resolvase